MVPPPERVMVVERVIMDWVFYVIIRGSPRVPLCLLVRVGMLG